MAEPDGSARSSAEELDAHAGGEPIEAAGTDGVGDGPPAGPSARDALPGDGGRPAPTGEEDLDADGSQTPPARTGLAVAGAQDFSLAAAIGGPRGALESLVPPVLFVVVYTISSHLQASLIAAVGVSVVFLLARVVTRSAPTQAISGVIGVAICAFFALRSGEARDFFLPGFFINAGYGTAFLLSLVPLPRIRAGGRDLPPGPYPLLGLFLGFLLGEGLSWRDLPVRRRAYHRLTIAWGAFFWLKVAVQVPLYLTEQLQALGIAKVAMGVPAYAFMCWITWLVLRRIPRADRPNA